MHDLIFLQIKYFFLYYVSYGNINLHHALLGHRLGGGIAYVGALCNPNFGFGLSANLEGNFASLDASALWDLTVFAHELGEPPKLFPCRSSDDLQ